MMKVWYFVKKKAEGKGPGRTREQGVGGGKRFDDMHLMPTLTFVQKLFETKLDMYVGNRSSNFLPKKIHIHK